jgi:hypothetical protein
VYQNPQIEGLQGRAGRGSGARLIPSRGDWYPGSSLTAGDEIDRTKVLTIAFPHAPLGSTLDPRLRPNFAGNATHSNTSAPVSPVKPLLASTSSMLFMLSNAIQRLEQSIAMSTSRTLIVV